MKHFSPGVAAIILLTTISGWGIQEKPNIVVVMADDIGLGDVSFYHRERTGREPVVDTPHLDSLIKAGMRFSDAHSPASLCAPTRFSMLTGNFSYRNSRPYGVWTPEADALIDPKFTTSARMAKAGGYHTAFFGKWGLGGSWLEKQPDYTRESGGALHYGFDYACELPEGIQNRPFAFYENQQWMKLKPDSILTEISADQTGYSTSRKHLDRGGWGDSNWDPALAGPVLAAKAVSYIHQQAASNPDGYFFMYYCSQAVHIPHAPPVELNGVPIAGQAPGVHGDMIRELDTQVGMLVDALKSTGQFDRTLFIFTSDNGGLSFDRNMTRAGHVTSNGLRGSKGSISEGGHRVPFIAVWPGVIQPNSECHEPIVGHDVVATIAALAHQTLDRTRVKDSVNLHPYFTGQPAGRVHAYLMHQANPNSGPMYALREGAWKLIIKGKRPNEMKDLTAVALFNLEDNLAEKEAGNKVHDPAHGPRVKAMLEKYYQLRASGVATVADTIRQPEVPGAP